ncbi:BtpA/SgcQ family protein [Halalkalicoccus subterraneus]|uniref:BtpA/SgcQ family protein n=1 Tax=Halalkalicoccus subterraneus TaxID=2675002 RepID=UPI000EFC8D56|nr:BtpA/SgcQ family protein [Halalkalicoccus subterraneus]
MHLDAIGSDKPIIGMVHLPALPGAPAYDGDFEAVREAAVRDARRLESGGVDALMVENFGDAPFYPEDVPKHVVASMTRVAGDLREAVDLPLGINVLRNDAAAALSVANAAGAGFVRVNVHVGARVTDQGIVEGRAHETMRLRERLESDVAVLADIDVKHSAPLAERAPDEPEGEEVAEAIERGLAEGLVVSGAGTGHAVAGDHLSATVAARDERGLDAPVFVGSGVTAETVAEVLDAADGAIVGTALKEGGETTAPVDEERVRELVAVADEAR